MHYLDAVLRPNNPAEIAGVTSVCSAHPNVIEAALRHGLALDAPVLIEATCNQVNQFGGYTQLTPVDFVRYVHNIADRVGFSHQNLILGGDHLGPLVWVNEGAASAMEKAKALVRSYVRAGFRKIHLDCSMPCAGDQELPVEIIAQRTAELVKAAEEAAVESGVSPDRLRYVIGSEVPSPGGTEAGEDHLVVTHPADAAQTIELTHRAFNALELDRAWDRVIALVVQPGVEFGDENIHEYDRVAAAALARFIETFPGLVYEAHSTDYQNRTALQALVEDHFRILKVGPGLTFAFREAVFALAEMEEALIEDEPSHIREVLESAMLENPVYWQKHYAGTSQKQKFARFYSFSDRIRYYWTSPKVQVAFTRLLKNLGDDPLPLSLISQYMPDQYERIRAGEIQNRPGELMLRRVMDVLDDYAMACGIKEKSRLE
jgi:D-tagatose-1,6-bisphosphate aldolase subunit GatZ/KbaZ